jgi:two-component sensor histidine kinase
MKFNGSLILLLFVTGAYAQQPAIADYEKQISYYRYYKQDSAIYLANKALNQARAGGDSAGVAFILVQQGMIDDNQGEFEQARKKYQQALDLFTAYQIPDGRASARIRLGVVELRNGRYDKAGEYFYAALEDAEKYGNAFRKMEAYYSISWAYLDQHKYQPALQYLKQAERLIDSVPFSGTTLNIYNHMGVIYRETGKLSQARNYLEKALPLSNKPEYQGLNITIVNNLATVYARTGHTQQAVQLQLDALERSRRIGNYLRELQCLSGLAKTYGKDEPKKAILYLDQAVKLARDKGNYRQEIRFLKNITPIYLEQGDYRNAYAAKEREHELADSFLYKSMSENMNALQAEYELTKSRARVNELSLANNKRKLELEKSTITRNVTIAGAALMLVIMGLLYNQYQLKQKSNKAISRKNEALQKLLEEKEWLLREVHHRVKNNLHTIMSLLEAQSAYLKDDALMALRISQHRVYAMSLMHQKLYQVANVTAIDMAVYLPELLTYLRDSFDLKGHVRFDSQIDHISLDISQAIPIALILNEAITNSIKYAFPDGASGEIRIRMIRTEGGKIMLEVADNGIGLPAHWESLQQDSLGLRLIRGLSDDINARLQISSGPGTSIRLEFDKTDFTKITNTESEKSIYTPG